MASNAVLPQFLAMERSLRATGCELPLWVIPYNEDRFELPKNAYWLENEKLFDFLASHHTMQMMRRYACLLESHFQYVDADCIFLQNPEEILKNHTGWITCCSHWSNPGYTFTAESLKFLKNQSTTWAKRVFNAGQFASDRALYSLEDFITIASHTERCETVLKKSMVDQPGLNWMVALKKDLPYTNLTLPPYDFESSWAGDYDGSPYPFWENKSRKPYLIHWAGRNPTGRKPIDELFFQYLTNNEKENYLKELKYEEENYAKDDTVEVK